MFPHLSPSLSFCLSFWHHRCVYIASRWVLPWQTLALSLYLNCLSFITYMFTHKCCFFPRHQMLLYPINPEFLMLPCTSLLFVCVCDVTPHRLFEIRVWRLKAVLSRLRNKSGWNGSKQSWEQAWMLPLTHAIFGTSSLMWCVSTAGMSVKLWGSLNQR